MARRVGLQVIPALMWLVSAALGLVAVVQVYEASRAIAAWMIPIAPLQTAISSAQAVLAGRVVLILAAIGWIVWVIWLLEHYYSAARERRLCRQFVITSAIELGVAGLASFVVYALPELALRGML